MTATASNLYHGAYRPHNGYVLSYSGSVLAALEISGADPDGMSDRDRDALTIVIRNLLNILPDNLILSQYYIHFDDQAITLRERQHPVSKQIRDNRQRYLNSQKLSGSRCILFVELYSRSDSQHSAIKLVKHLFAAINQPASREYVKRAVLYGEACGISKQTLGKLSNALSVLVNEIADYCAGVFDVRILDLDETYRTLKFFSTCDTSYLDATLQCPDVLDSDLLDGQLIPVTVQGMELLKIVNALNTYVRVLSVKQFNFAQFNPGVFATGANAPIRCRGNYILCTRYKALSPFQRSWMFLGREKELERETVSFGDFVKGIDGSSDKDMQVFKPSLVRKFQELDEAAALTDNWGLVSCHAVAFNTDVKVLERDIELLKSTLQQAGLSIVWETVAAMDVFFDVQPASDHRTKFLRDIPLNASQYATLSLVYRSAQGIDKVEDIHNEEAQYIFTSSDNTPFYYSSFTGGRGVTVGVGPIRSGKSFLRVALGMHWMKYGGLFRAIDIDPGSEPIAEAFGEEGGIFRIDDDKQQGFNLFTQAVDEKDTTFVNHLLNLIIMMIESNSSEEMRQLSLTEQMAIDKAITNVLKMPKDMQRLLTMAQHCPKSVMQKLSRFIGTGHYAALFDSPIDAIGEFTKPVGVFNLAGIKEDETAKKLAMSEITYRIFRLFENPAYRTVPKWLDLDEVHHLLENPYITNDLIVKRIRTWGKWLGGLGMWTQSGVELGNIPDWPAIRSATSTFIFTADPTIDKEAYKAIFHLKDGEVDAIKTLIPKREVYIIQPDLNISKRCTLDVEPEQYVLSTSKPTEARLRQMNVERYGFDAGIKKTLQQLNNEGLENEAA